MKKKKKHSGRDATVASQAPVDPQSPSPFPAAPEVSIQRHRTFKYS